MAKNGLFRRAIARVLVELFSSFSSQEANEQLVNKLKEKEAHLKQVDRLADEVFHADSLGLYSFLVPSALQVEIVELYNLFYYCLNF